MKIAKCLLLITFFLSAIAAQPVSSEEDLIRDFLVYVANPAWNIDTVTTKYVEFKKEESKVASRVTRKFYLALAVSKLADELKKVRLDELKIVPYEHADEKLQILSLDDDFRERSYIVFSPDRTFIRYFLIKENQIQGFVLFQEKVYLLLN